MSSKSFHSNSRQRRAAIANMLRKDRKKRAKRSGAVMSGLGFREVITEIVVDDFLLRATFINNQIALFPLLDDSE